MIWRMAKIGALATAGVLVVGGLVFGTDLRSYVTSSASSVRAAVKDAVPLEFELRRAKDMLEQVLPEMHANIRMIAQEEVEIAALKADIEKCKSSLSEEETKTRRLRDMLGTTNASFQIRDARYDRDEVKDELSRRFDRIKEAKLVLDGKERLLANRGKSLRAAIDLLEKTKGEKVRLEDQVQALEAQYRLVQAASVGSPLQIDAGKLAQTQKLIGEIRNRLDVAERVLAHEAKFTQEIPVSGVEEKDLVAQVDEYFGGPQAQKSAEKQGVELSQAK